ncbi:MAG TPA: ABC transporter ATP-binding protein [Clostridium sp.]|uniref:ABC transporter ATP-binding protein n=1 Tax=Clostridium sp. TaxID=1506 RepID=UPI002F91FB2E
MRVSSGEIFALLGPNGAGKTSTLECIEGIRKVSGGKILINGISPEKDYKKIAKILGVQLQASSLPEMITVEEAIKMFSLYLGNKIRFDLIERFNLTCKRKTQFRNLSTGEQRKLVLAIALSNNPKLLILDEPTAGLDVYTRVELHNVMREEKQKGTAILLASHDMNEAEELADRVSILCKGRIVAEGTPNDIITSGNNVVKILVKTRDNSLIKLDLKQIIANKENKDYVIFKCLDIEKTLTDILTYIKANNDKLVDIIIEKATLEERFIDITSREENYESSIKSFRI